MVLLLYGGGWMDDIQRLGPPGIRRLFGRKLVPDPTTCGFFEVLAFRTEIYSCDGFLIISQT